ncbi:MAG: hypothetical protein M1482_14985 [Chloroflexi bacterium]|nr:hypothetical protein [Chloroflexota bacterium]
MFILAFLVLAGIAWLVGMVAVAGVRSRLAAYSALALALAVGGLVIFTVLSMWLGLVRLGVPYDLNIPDDYIARGLAGVAILVVGLAGVVSPLVAAWLVSRRARPSAR